MATRFDGIRCDGSAFSRQHALWAHRAPRQRGGGARRASPPSRVVDAQAPLCAHRHSRVRVRAAAAAPYQTRTYAHTHTHADRPH